MPKFTVDGIEVDGEARLIEDPGGGFARWKISGTVSKEADADVFRWWGQKLRFEGPVRYPDGAIRHAEFYVMLSERGTGTRLLGGRQTVAFAYSGTDD